MTQNKPSHFSQSLDLETRCLFYFFDKKMKKYRYGVSGVAGLGGSPHLTENKNKMSQIEMSGEIEMRLIEPRDPREIR